MWRWWKKNAERFRETYLEEIKTPLVRVVQPDSRFSIEYFASIFSKVKDVDFSSRLYRNEITEFAMLYISSTFGMLSSLNISGCNKLTDRFVEYLVKFLERGLLELYAEELSSEFIVFYPYSNERQRYFWDKRLARFDFKILPICNLKVLSLAKNSWLRWSHVEHFLQSCPLLENLDLSNTNIFVEEVVDFSNLACRRTLRRINFANCLGLIKSDVDRIKASCSILNDIKYTLQ